MQTRTFSYNLLRITEDMPCVCACVGILGQQIFINIPLFTFTCIYTLLSLKYYGPDTRSSVNICHIILTRFLTLPRTSDAIQVSLLVSLSVKWYICLNSDSYPLSHDPEALSWTKHVDQTSASGLYNENDRYNEHIPCVVVVVCWGLKSLSTIFQSYHDGDWLRQGAQCSLLYVASLKYHAPDT